jgi:glycerol-3-phosphate acyltransferase PlsX
MVETGSKNIVIAIDAMGGDFGPYETVIGSLDGARAHGVDILLVGDEDLVENVLSRENTEGVNVSVIPSFGKIAEGENPIKALRAQPRASVSTCVRLLKENRANAMVTMGSTGAAMASATLGLGLLDSLERPCIGGPVLGMAPNTSILDLGSNIDSRPTQLLNFATMGCVFARKFFEIRFPRVALLSVGSEKGKGNRQIKDAYPIFAQSHLNFIGNVEGFDLLSNKADVIVCDGFVGNIILKFAEAMGDAASVFLEAHLHGKIKDIELSALKYEMWKLTNISTQMSGPLFGVDGNVIIGHGASKSAEIGGAMETAKRCVELDLVKGIKDELEILKKGFGSQI